MSNVAAILLWALAAVLVVLILKRTLKFPLLMELGMAMVSMGFIGAADALFTDAVCTERALLTRWGLIGGGLFLMLVSVAWRMRSRPHGRRMGDILLLSENEMRHIKGGQK